MRKGLLFIMIFGWLFGPPSKVQEAHDLYSAGKYLEAGNLYASETDNYPGQMPEITFNSAQAYFKADSLEKGMSQFGKTCNMAKQDPQLASWAWNNVGITHLKNLENAQKQTQQAPQGMQQGSQPAANPEQTQAMLLTALQAFKDALKLDHDNDFARYNYELLMRRMKQQEKDQQQQQQEQKEDKQEQQQDQEQQEKNKQDQSQDQEDDSPEKKENKADQDPKQGDGEGEGKESQMSGEEAQRLLEAMESNEKKFLQQLEKGKKRKVYSEKNGHDW